MPVDVSYWYSGRLVNLIRQTLRVFSDYYISIGKDDSGQPILKRVPVSFMSTDKSALALLNKNSDTTLQSFPKMILAISRIGMGKEINSGAAFEETEDSVTEKYFNEETGEYEYKRGESYNVTRLNPIPLTIDFTLFVATTMQSQKFQLFEQLRAVFNQPLDVQTSENALDLSRMNSLALTDINWSSRGTSNLDSSQIDTMELQFHMTATLDLPALVQRQSLINKIGVTLSEGDNDIFGLEELETEVFTPSNVKINVFYDEDTNTQIAEIVQDGNEIKTWHTVFNQQKILYNPLEPNTYLTCDSAANTKHPFSFKGKLVINESKPTQAILTLEEDTIPSTNVPPVSAVIDPHNYSSPKTEIGTRYLLSDSIPSKTKLWGEIKASNGAPLPYAQVESESIIEYTQDGWTLSLSPTISPAVYFVRDNSHPEYLYTYNIENKFWVDCVNKKYAPTFWHITQPKQ